MSDQTKTTDQFSAARERERLGDEYRAAYREARSGRTGPTQRLQAAAENIRDNPQVFDDGLETREKFIDGIEREVDRDLNVEVGRQRLAKALDDTHKQIAELGRQIARMSGNEQYDEEIAEGDTVSMQAALTGLRVNLAALRGLTRHATPENQP
jgi:hypothetical protein